MGSVNPGQVVLGGVRKQAEQALGSNLVNRIPPWPLLVFFSPGSCLDFLH